MDSPDYFDYMFDQPVRLFKKEPNHLFEFDTSRKIRKFGIRFNDPEAYRFRNELTNIAYSYHGFRSTGDSYVFDKECDRTIFLMSLPN